MKTEDKLVADPGNGVETSGRKVLLLEDDQNFNDALSEYLSLRSYEVVKTLNGVEGVREVLARDFDVIICDMMMPNLPGDMFYLAVQRIKPHLNRRFIFITGHPANPKVSNFLENVEVPQFEKPFQLDLLIEAIEAIGDESHGKN